MYPCGVCTSMNLKDCQSVASDVEVEYVTYGQGHITNYSSHRLDSISVSTAYKIGKR
jgi:hypothetical protein